MREKRFLVVLAGPTAIGKTALSIQLAKQWNTSILSADSRQFYREMTIGTAKPTLEELLAVPHFFINSHNIQDSYTAGRFAEDALEKLVELFKTNSVVFLVGGSGLFIKALCDGMDEIPKVEESIRIQLNREFSDTGLDFLLKELQTKDPVYYGEVDRSNPVRIIRALEVIRGTNLPYSSFRTGTKKERPFECIKIGLERPREELYERINLRIDQMILEGLLEEVTGLVPYKSLNALQTVGYSEVFDYLEGKYDLEECIRLLKQNTRHYAKRQMTWFTKDKEFRWFHPDSKDEMVAYIKSRME